MHDTVRAVVRDPAFYRSVRNSFADRLLIWLLDAIERFGKALKHLPSGRSIGLGIVVLLVIFLLARLIIATRQDSEARSGTLPRRGGSTSSDLWLSAEALAESGRHEEAAHAYYRAVISAMGRDERLKLDPSKTSGDYARELGRRNSPALAPFRAFTRRFDAVVYGYEGANAEAVAELQALSAPFRKRALAA